MIQGIVALVGRPNTGKSTLFNALTHTRRALVDDRPGVTRDRLYGVVHDPGDEAEGFVLIDTGGFEPDPKLARDFPPTIIWEQTKAALMEADILVFVLDARSGVLASDKELLRELLKLGKPIKAVINKVDGREQEQLSLEFHELGLEDLHPISAAHNRGLGDLRAEISSDLEAIKGSKTKKEVEGAVRIALLGRPNAGKSSILNRLLGHSRALVSPIAGTTRDALDTPLTYNQNSYVLIDTAGIRRKSRIDDRLEQLSVIQSLSALERADVVVMVIAADEGLSDQDARLMQLAAQKFKPTLLVVNKWDLVSNKDSATALNWEKAIRAQIRDISYVPILFSSALENQRVHKILPAVEKLYGMYTRRVPTSRLNEVLETALRAHTPQLLKASFRRVKFYYATQVKAKPPTIVLKCNVAEEVQASYKRYLTNRFRAALGFEEVPLRLLFRGKDQKSERRSVQAAAVEPQES